MKPERIQFAPTMGGNNHVPEPDWQTTVTVDRTFVLAPSSQAPFLCSVLQRAQSLPNPPKVFFMTDAVPGERGGYATSVHLEWSDGGPLTDVEIGFTRWIRGLHDHLSVAPVVTN